jgi:hypothetical protein
MCRFNPFVNVAIFGKWMALFIVTTSSHTALAVLLLLIGLLIFLLSSHECVS